MIKVEGCELALERRVEKSTENKDKYIAMQKHTLHKEFPQKKVDKIIFKAHETGSWYADDDLPEDEDMRWYWVRVGQSYTKKDKVTESFGIKATGKITNAEAKEATAAGGALEVMRRISKQSTANTNQPYL